MSGENVEQLRRIYAEWGRGNFRGGEELFAPDVACSWPVPEGRAVAHGIREIGQNLREFLKQWSHFRVEAREFVEVHENSVFVVTRGYLTGKQSGVQLEGEAAFHVWEFRGDKAVGWHVYFDRDEALLAAGLSE